MGLDKRIEALEKLYHTGTAEERYTAEQTHEELSRKAWVQHAECSSPHKACAY